MSRSHPPFRSAGANNGEGGGSKEGRGQAPVTIIEQPRRVEWTAVVSVIGVMIASVATIIGNRWISDASIQAKLIETKGAFDAKMVEIGVGILAADPGKDVIPARKWAIDLVEAHSGQSFAKDDRELLLHHPIQTAQLPTFLRTNGAVMDYDTLRCDQWKRNPDGSWTTVGSVTFNNITMDNVTLNHTRETDILEKKCGSKN